MQKVNGADLYAADLGYRPILYFLDSESESLAMK